MLIGLKLISGDEIIGTLVRQDEETGDVILSRVRKLCPHLDASGNMVIDYWPFIYGNIEAEFTFYEETIICYYEPDDSYTESYTKLINNGLDIAASFGVN